jgi:AraC-like DNA-binding protein
MLRDLSLAGDRLIHHRHSFYYMRKFVKSTNYTMIFAWTVIAYPCERSGSFAPIHLASRPYTRAGPPPCANSICGTKSCAQVAGFSMCRSNKEVSSMPDELLRAGWPPENQIRGAVAVGIAPPQGGLASWQLSRINHIIDADLMGRIRIADLAASIRLSPSYFYQAFRRSTGVSPYAYVIRRRMERVQELLLCSSLSVSQIALECGLADQPHLSRQFRRIVGISPAAWRRAQRARPSPG